MFRKRIDSFRHAGRGLADILRHQANARIHLALALAALGLGLFLGLTVTEWAVLVLTIGWVLSLEAMNTALEHLTDLVSPGQHPLAGKAKDAAAAGVLIGACLATLLGLLLFGPKLLRLLLEWL